MDENSRSISLPQFLQMFFMIQKRVVTFPHPHVYCFPLELFVFYGNEVCPTMPPVLSQSNMEVSSFESRGRLRAESLSRSNSKSDPSILLA